MKIQADDGHSYEVFCDGKPLPDDAGFEIVIAAASLFFPFAVITHGDKVQPVRAITFATDEEYIDKLIECMEEQLPEGQEITGMILNSDDDPETGKA